MAIGQQIHDDVIDFGNSNDVGDLRIRIKERKKSIKNSQLDQIVIEFSVLTSVSAFGMPSNMVRAWWKKLLASAYRLNELFCSV